MQYPVQVGQDEVRGSRPLCFMATSSASLEAHPELVSRGKLGSDLLSCRVGSCIAPASPLPGAGPALLVQPPSGLVDRGGCCDLQSTALIQLSQGYAEPWVPINGRGSMH